MRILKRLINKALRKHNLDLVSNVKLYADGELVSESHNVTTVVGRELIMESITDGAILDTRIKYLEIGIGTPDFVQSATSLSRPAQRVVVVTPARVSNTQREYRIPLGSPNIYIREMGLFMGRTANRGIGSGILFNLAPVDHDGRNDNRHVEAVITINLRDAS